MAYETGSIASMAALKTTVENFAVTNGFTLTNGFLCDAAGGSYTKITTPTTAWGRQYLLLEGANDSVPTLLIGTATYYAGAALYVDTLYLPCTYHLFYIANPKTIYIVVQYNTYYASLAGFGTVIKPSMYTGGNFYFGPANGRQFGWDSNQYQMASHSRGLTWNAGQIYGYGTVAPGLPFWKWETVIYANSFIHAEIDGAIWNNHYKSGDVWNTGAGPEVTCQPLTGLLLQRNPNAWNGQAVLFPVILTKYVASSYSMDIGTLNGIRYLRIDNYNSGDIIDLSPDKWMVFPAMVKNVASRDGNPYTFPGITGTFGYAIKYDGP